MGFSAGTTTVTTTVRITGTVPAPGNAPENALADPSTASTVTTTQSLTYGTSSGKVDVPCAGEFLIAAGGSLTLNLYDGGTTTSDLTTLFGGAANLRRLKSMTFSVVSGGGTEGVAIGGAASNAHTLFLGDTSDKAKIFPSGPALPLGSPAGETVTSTAKNVKLENLSSTESVVVRVTASGNQVEPGYAMGVLGLTYA